VDSTGCSLNGFKKLHGGFCPGTQDQQKKRVACKKNIPVNKEILLQQVAGICNLYLRRVFKLWFQLQAA
jgi:hypothetical protein